MTRFEATALLIVAAAFALGTAWIIGMAGG